MNTKLKNVMEKGKTGLFYTFYNGIGIEEFYITVGFENYNISQVKDQNGVYRVKTSGDRDVVATIDKNNNYFFVHKGKIQLIGKRDFKVVKDGVMLLKFQHGKVSSTYEIHDISEHITEDNQKLPATDIVNMVPVDQELNGELSEVEQLSEESDRLQLLAEESVVSNKELEPINFGEIQMAAQAFGDGVTFEVKGTKLLLEIDLEGNYGKSKTGKSHTVASTRGNKTVPGTDIKVGLNVYRPVI